MILTVRTTSKGCYWVARDQETQIVTYGATEKRAERRNLRAVQMFLHRLGERKEAES